MFYKKSLSFVLALIIAFSVVLLGGQMIFAKADSIDAQDQAFLDFVREDTGEQQINYTHIQLYNEQLTPNGRQYTFTVGNTQGYALTAKVVIDGVAFYEVEELFYNKPAPFVNYQGMPVYITFNAYLDYVNDTFYDLADNRAIVTQAVVAELAYKGFGYMGDTGSGYVGSSEEISYSTKSTELYSFPYNAPDIDSGVNGCNCANSAGAVVIGYYDRFYENLIPNYTSYFAFGQTLIYKSGSDEIVNVIETLNEYMAVEGVTQGTTFTGYQQGMERYVEEHGYTYSTTSLLSWGSLDFDEYKQTVSQEIPVGLFLNGFTMSGVAEGDNMDTIRNSSNTATHVETGIGYRQDTYYNANGGVIATRKYAKVVSGLYSYGIGYLNVSGNVTGQIVYAIAININ